MTELAVYQPPSAEVAVPDARDTDSWIAVCSDVIKVANVIHDTPFVPEGLRGSAPAVAAAILAGRELGIGPMTALQHIHVIKGKPAQSAALMRALILAAGHKIETVDISDTRCVIRGQRKGESSWEEASFTADQARAARIDLGGYPQDKLYARATSRLARRKFADVIAGMPYSAEELEDGADGDGAPAAVAAPAAEAKPRTARRRTSQQKPYVDDGSKGINMPPAATPAPADPPMPPLPGEDESSEERDYDSPGTVTTPQLTAIWTVFSKVYGFTADEKEHAREVAGHIAGRELPSTRDMSHNEAKAVLDTLANWREVAEANQESPRDVLIAAMAGEPSE